MSKKVNTSGQLPSVAGLGARDVATNQKSIPSTYFAGLRRLPVSWLMEPVNQFTTNASGGKGSKGI